MKLIIDIPEEEYEIYSSLSEREKVNDLTGDEKLIAYGTPIPDNPQPKTGHWIEGQTDNPNIHNILCSCCFEGYPSKGHANSQYTREKFKFCPNCGFRMVEPQAESEEV